MSFDVSGSDECNQQLLGNTVYAATRIKGPEEHEVDGNSLSFTRVYTTNAIKTAAELAAENLPLASGYALGGDLSAHAMWSWQDRFLSGYTPDRARPTSSPLHYLPLWLLTRGSIIECMALLFLTRSGACFLSRHHGR